MSVIPGITAALGCASSAGLSLTKRGVSRAVTFVTAHAREGDATEPDWARLADPKSTLAIYMGREARPPRRARSDQRRPVPRHAGAGGGERLPSRRAPPPHDAGRHGRAGRGGGRRPDAAPDRLGAGGPGVRGAGDARR
ncbi:Uroporphyrinogen-III methyltransferase (EC 2.1.1.107) [Azospirillum argentinense]